MRRHAVQIKRVALGLLVCVAIGVIPTTAYAFEVNFPDANLEAAIRTAINQATGPILDTSLLKLTSLNASFRNIAVLNGLEFCPNITQLQLHGNNIKDISALASLPKLVDVYLWQNQIEDVSPLRDLTDLRFVFLQDNLIEDITVLGSNAGLGKGDVVNLTGNPLNQDSLCTTVDDILRPHGVTVYVTFECGTVVVNIPDANLEARLRIAINKPTGNILDTDLLPLTTLDATDAGIHDLTGLEFCVNLMSLKLSGNRIQDISVMPRLGKVVQLYLGGNAISDLTPLTGAYGLTYLELQNQHKDDGTKVLASLDGIQFLGGLRFLYLHDNQIADISKLSWLLNLQQLTLGNNQISDISVLDGLDQLTQLDVSGNQITDVTPLARLTGVIRLSIANNRITRIDRLSGLTNLTVFDASYNGITNINVLVNLLGLTELYLGNNHIANITSLAGLAELGVLMLQNNSISDISALEANSGLGPHPAVQRARDQVNVKGNQLSQENLCHEIPALLARDIDLQYDGHCCAESFALTTAVRGAGTIDPAEGVRRFCQGATVTVTATELPGSLFDHWEGDLSGSVNPTTVTMDSDVHVTAVFRDTTVTYTLTLVVGGDGIGGTVSATGQNPYASGALVTVTATPAPGWLFDHWEGDLGGKTNPSEITMNADKTIRAVFVREPVKYTLTTSVVGHGTIDPPAGQHQYPEGTGVTVRATPDFGWAFDHWEGDLSGSANPNAIGMTSDKSVIAVFKEKFTLTMAVVGSGTVDPPVGDTQFPQGSAVLVRATPDLGWVFDHWEGDLTGSDNPVTLTMTGNKKITAVFKEDTFDFSLAMVVDGNGTTSPAPGFSRYKAGAKVRISATPDANWVFDHWSGDFYGDESPATITMDADKTITAVFVRAPVSYTLTTAVEGEGDVLPHPGARRYAAGKQITLVATPNLGWAFDHWEGDVGGQVNPFNIIMDADKSVTAVFRKSPTITAISPDKGSTAGGEEVIIYGLHLTTATAVLFGEKAAQIESISDSGLKVVTPEGPNPRGVVDVVVETALGTAKRIAGFTFIEPPGPPELGSVLPTRGSVLGGDVVLIRGRNLAITQKVMFGDIPALIASSEDTRLYVATLPHEPGTVDITVTTSTGTATLTQAFTYVVKPQVVAVAPNQGSSSGGETVRIFGVGLDNPKAVTFGAQAATVNSSSDSSIEVLTPPHPAGTVEVTVTTAGGIGTLLGAFNYYEGGASLLCSVVDEGTQAPILNATVQATGDGLAAAGVLNSDNVYAVDNLRPGTYVVVVTAPGYAVQIRSVTVQLNEIGSETFQMKPNVGATSGCGPVLKRLDLSVTETTVPLSVDEAPQGVAPQGVAPQGVAPQGAPGTTGALAIRLTSTDAIDPGSAWAAIEGKDWFLSDGVWRATSPDDDRDGWVVFVPKEPLPAGETVTMTVGAVTTAGVIVGPVAKDFLVSAEKEADTDAPALKEETVVPDLSEILAAPKSAVYCVTPVRVFAQPVTIEIPVPVGSRAEDLEVYYYSESTAHAGWYRGDHVTGWIVPDSRRNVVNDGQAYIEIQVNYAGVLQLGQNRVSVGGAAPGTFGVTGSRSLWLSLGSILLALSFVLGRLATQNRRG